MDNGIMFRAGLAGGAAYHSEDPPSGSTDVRTRDITIIGDGFTSAVKAESSQKQSGVHAWLHPELITLLGGPHDGIGTLRPNSTEFLWWKNLSTLWPYLDAMDYSMKVPGHWIDNTIERLQSAPEFDWNRKTEKGAGVPKFNRLSAGAARHGSG